MRPRELFLSHATADHEAAERLANVLVHHGIPVFYAPRHILGAQQWQDEILAALQRCDWFAVLLSPEAAASMWVKREVSFVLNERRYENQIVPLYYRPCDLGTLAWLSLFQRIDFSGEFRGCCRQLLRCWGVDMRADSP